MVMEKVAKTGRSSEEGVGMQPPPPDLTFHAQSCGDDNHKSVYDRCHHLLFQFHFS